MAEKTAAKEVKITEVTRGFYELKDTAIRANVIAFYDGESWWMPGSSICFPPESVGYNTVYRGSRFRITRHIEISDRLYGDWKIQHGQFV